MLIDSGLSVRELERRLASIGRKADELDAVFLTHEHSDHVSGVGPLVRRYGIPLYATEGTMRAGEKSLGRATQYQLICAGEPVQVDGLALEPYATSHDARESVAYVVHCKNRRLGHATDMGVVIPTAREKLKNAHVLLVESNHDIEMLDVGPYPWSVKQRIKSEFGHLSNEACGDLLATVSHSGLKQVVLMHLSHTNNHPEIAYITARQAMGSHAPQMVLAQQDRATELVEV